MAGPPVTVTVRLGTRLGPGRRSLRLAAGSTVADVLRPSSGTRRTFAARPRPFIRTRIVHETGAHNAELDRGRTVRGLVFEPPKVTSELNGWAGRGAVHLSDRSGSHRLGLDIGEAAATGLPHSAAITFSIRLHDLGGPGGLRAIAPLVGPDAIERAAPGETAALHRDEPAEPAGAAQARGDRGTVTHDDITSLAQRR